MIDLITYRRDNYPAHAWKADWLKPSHWLHDDGRIVTRSGETVCPSLTCYLGGANGHGA